MEIVFRFFAMLHGCDIFLVASSIFGCLLLNMLINRLFLIPTHRPSKERLIHAWNAGIVHRYIAVIEEGID